MNTNRTRRIVSLGASVVMCIASQTVAAPHWGLQSTSGPSARELHAMTYDSFREVVVLFGGQDGSNTLNDTWEWNGQSWTPRLTSGAGPHAGHSMAYDSTRHVTVLFGGAGLTSYLNETWEWDGNTWTQKFPGASPSARHGAGMAFDSTRNRILMFGGYQPGLTNDTWTWDGTSWSSVSTTTPPSARSWVGMAYDRVRDRTVLFGGSCNPVCQDPQNSDETWELDLSTSPATWTQVSTTNKPPARHRGQLVYDSVHGKMLLFGGTLASNANAGDTWALEGEPLDWALIAKPGSPMARDAHAMVYDVARQEALMFGGGLGFGASGCGSASLWVTRGRLASERRRYRRCRSGA